MNYHKYPSSTLGHSIFGFDLKNISEQTVRGIFLGVTSYGKSAQESSAIVNEMYEYLVHEDNLLILHKAGSINPHQPRILYRTQAKITSAYANKLA